MRGTVQPHMSSSEMALDAAALLDQLMGKNRNATPGDDSRETNWWDAEVWRCYVQWG